MQFIKAARAQDLQPGGKLKVQLADKTLLLTNVDGNYYAIDNRCPHMGGSLFDGTLDGDTIACPRHKTVFSVRTGDVIQNGRLAMIRLKVKDAKAYPVKVENGDILVGI